MLKQLMEIVKVKCGVSIKINDFIKMTAVHTQSNRVYLRLLLQMDHFYLDFFYNKYYTIGGSIKWCQIS
jgi:hypothetical protein